MAPADLRYVRFQDLEGRDLTSYVHVRSVRQTKQKGAWSDFLGGNAFVRVERTVSFGAHFELYSEFWLREEEFVRLDGISQPLVREELVLSPRQAVIAPNVAGRPMGSASRHCPQMQVRVLGLEAGQPGFVMELRGYTLRDRPLSYQCLFSGPFSERFVASCVAAAVS